MKTEMKQVWEQSAGEIYEPWKNQGFVETVKEGEIRVINALVFSRNAVMLTQNSKEGWVLALLAE